MLVTLKWLWKRDKSESLYTIEFLLDLLCHCRDLLVNLWIDCFVIDNADVLYNKFNVDSSSPPDNPPARPNSNYNCVVATTDQWRVSHCDEQHHVVCQSDHDTLSSGIMTTCSHSHLFTYWLSLVVRLLAFVCTACSFFAV